MEHPYAHILRAIADGEQIQRESFDIVADWINVTSQYVLQCISTGTSLKFRVKPRTITINGIAVPEPMRVAPADGSNYYVPTISTEITSSTFKWDDDSVDKRSLQRGLVHATREAAEAHARALLSFTEVK